MARLALIAIAGLVAATAAGWMAFAETPSLAAKVPSICLKDTASNGPHSGMVWIPAGKFEFGDTVYREEGPIVDAHVAGFWMDRHEVTNAEFASFVKATGYVTQAEKPVDAKVHPELPPDMLKAGAMTFVMPKSVEGMQNISQWWRYTPGANWRHPAGPGSSIAGHENYPVVEVTYADALAYAKWKGRTLPTEREWEWAARAGNSKAGLDHDQPNNANTWQGIFPVVNSDEDGFVGLAPAGCYPSNAYGLYDMIGNAWEWTSDVFATGHTVQEPSQLGEMRSATANKSYVIKGGSFLCAPNYCMRYRSGAREPQEADLAASHLGFRTILRAPGPKSVKPERP